MSETASPLSQPGDGQPYIVVARRYRPKSFDDLVGQQHISQALTNAIATSRVGHAYLFTGARGVGKTSTARIFAKALNAPEGATAHPDNDSDICQAIDAGEDVDVLEIDGASNRGIDEIRQLRSNANVRPSRARYKIYIIDEVHMLTPAAFNALLKTLEEPPKHVKFIFCTTDPQKIPITVLSRCQRFDFAPIDPSSILERLELIVQTEGREADKDALELLARRASGSMRDSQSLLEQLLAFSSGTIRIQDVHKMLGTAESGRLASIVQHLTARDAAQAIQSLDSAVAEGVDCGQFAEQMLRYFRDMMAVSVGCNADLLQQASASDFPSLEAAADEMGLATILAATEILDQAIVRMRQSTDPRILLEIAVVHISNLQDLSQISSLIEGLQGADLTPGTRPRSSAPRATAPRATKQGSTEPPARAPAAASRPANRPEKKNDELTAPPDSAATKAMNVGGLTAANANVTWKQVLDNMGNMTSDFASYCDSVTMSAPDCMAVKFCARYTLQKQSCETPDRKSQLEQAISEHVGRPIRVSFEIIPDAAPSQKKQAAKSRLQMMREKEDHSMVKQAVELFGAEVTRVEMPRDDA